MNTWIDDDSLRADPQGYSPEDSARDRWITSYLVWVMALALTLIAVMGYATHRERERGEQLMAEIRQVEERVK